MTSSAPTTSETCECGAPRPIIDLGPEWDAITLPRCAPCQAKHLAVENERERIRYRESLYSNARFPRRADGYTLATYRDAGINPGALEVADKWIALPEKRPSLILSGNVGAGKTGLALSMLRELIERREWSEDMMPPYQTPGLFVVWRDLLADMRESFNSGERNAAMLMERARSTPLLVLDDLGAERPTDWAREELAVLVQARYDRRLPSIVTTNYGGAELAGRLGHDDPIIGKRIVSRLLEDAWVVKFDGVDQRRKAA